MYIFLVSWYYFVVGGPHISSFKNFSCNHSVYFWMFSMNIRICIYILMGLSCGSAGKESTCNAGDLGSVPGLGGSPGEGKGYPL